jgi:hypothetical protein
LFGSGGSMVRLSAMAEELVRTEAFQRLVHVTSYCST